MTGQQGTEQTRRAGRARADAETPEARETLQRFREAVNMDAGELETWLATDQSKAVGQKRGGRGESTGHASGRRIVRLLGKAAGSYTAGDVAHMRKVTGYVHRHLAQRPSGDVADTPWRYSLMNWGHDPLKERSKRGAGRSAA